MPHQPPQRRCQSRCRALEPVRFHLLFCVAAVAAAEQSGNGSKAITGQSKGPERVFQMIVYANKPHGNLELLMRSAPIPVQVVGKGLKWIGTVDKLLGYWLSLRQVGDNDVVVLCDAFDVFGNGFSWEELIQRFWSFGKPIVISTEENIFPREVEVPAHEAIEVMRKHGWANASSGSRFVNAGGIIGIGWALKRAYEDMRANMRANNPQHVQAYADLVGHWFLHAYDQYELWLYFIRHVFAAHNGGEELLIALDTEQFIFGSTVMRKENWPNLLRESVPGVMGKISIDVDVPLVFDAPQSLYEIQKCQARFVGREHAPIFWHGHGPWKPAWEGLRDRLITCGCFKGNMPAPLEC